MIDTAYTPIPASARLDVQKASEILMQRGFPRAWVYDAIDAIPEADMPPQPRRYGFEPELITGALVARLDQQLLDKQLDAYHARN